MGALEVDMLNGIKHGFDNDVAELKVADPEVGLSVEGISFLNWVEDGANKYHEGKMKRTLKRESKSA